MREFLTVDSIANQIRMDRTLHKGAFLIVEGDKDARVYSRYVNEEKCRVVNAHNKQNAIDALARLEQGDVTGIVAIVDCDFDLLEGRSWNSSNVFFTDTHDLETLMLKSPALEKLLGEVGSTQKIKAFIKLRKKEIRDLLLTEGAHLGYLRWVSLRSQYNLKFENLSFSDFLDHQTLTIDFSTLVMSVKNNSQNHRLPEEEIKEQVKDLRDSRHDNWHLCCGHDLMSILSIGFRKALGTRKAAEVAIDILERELRLAYEAEHFSKTVLYSSVVKWETSNAPYKIFTAK